MYDRGDTCTCVDGDCDDACRCTSSAYDDDDDDENNDDDHDNDTQSSSCFIQHMPIFKKLNLFSFPMLTIRTVRSQQRGGIFVLA